MSEFPGKDAYKEKVNKCATTRLNIDDKWEKLRKIGKLFCKIYNINIKTFMLLHRANYYGPNDGSEDQTPAQLKNLVERFANTIKYLRAFNLTEDLDHWLKEYKITADVPSTPIDFKSVEYDVLIPELTSLLSHTPNKETLSTDLLQLTHGLQVEICNQADAIKKDVASEIKEEFKIEPPHFVKAVRISADQKKQKRISGKIEQMENLGQSAIKSVSIFDSTSKLQ